MGRKKTKGAFYKNGRRKQPTTTDARQKWDYGNDVVQQRRALFDAMCIKGGKAVDHVGDAAGQLWAVGKFDGHGFEADTLRDVARLYEELHRRNFGELDYKIQRYERSDRAYGIGLETTSRDVMFARFSEALPAGTFEQMAVYEIAIINRCADTLSPWIKAIVDYELIQLGRIPGGTVIFPTAHDYGILDAAIRGLCALLDAGLPARFQVRRAA